MAYARIDAIRFIRAMRRELLDLEPAFRREVILRALEYSHHQFAWRFFAGQFGVERSLWPNLCRRRRSTRRTPRIDSPQTTPQGPPLTHPPRKK